ncbi:SGNH/GDSL hydrolase family protein [Candidatus Uabimicrobium amorphum]|uniref:SGNH hydrolase-type esterase domain-containing protein n=1 Tax=Uabimicrobium amorphum TaxID=2596890 RepID=A0A5S9F0T4_UABAM|nr:SGNH/GDSL hydrolase family protein [Candidatus Uabimicrobium amorphum]BBM81692.1 hypothetical protein UABAM_00031 [Candidatus Uabimicrobium amorphum]
MTKNIEKKVYMPASLLVAVLLFLPVLLHFIALYINVSKAGFLLVRKIDMMVFVLLCAYMLAILLVSRRRDLSIKVALIVYASLFPVLMLELGIFLLGDENPRVPLPTMRVESVAGNNMPGIEGKVTFSVNKLGVRAPELWPTSRGDRILCVGGSTTECRYVTDEKSWPWLLGTALSKTLTRPILVANAGRSGHFTLHHLYQLQHYKLADEFGIVVILCGINDMGTFLRNNYEQRITLVPKESLTGSSAQGAYYHHSYLIQILKTAFARSSFAVRDAQGKWYNSLRNRRKKLLQQNTITTIPENFAYALDLYKSNLEKIIHHCSLKKQRLILLTQPTMYQKNISQELKKLIWQHTSGGAYTPETLAKIITEYNNTLKNVCKAHNVACVDLASLLPKNESTFYDDCHFNIRGCQQIVIHLQDAIVSKWKILQK